MAQTVKMKSNSDGQDRLQGQWQSIGVIRDEQYSEPSEATYYWFEEDHFKIQVPGKSETSIAYVTSDGQIPMQLDATLGFEKARMIYGFDSDRLWISHSKPGADRPNSLLDGNGYGLSVLVFQRMRNEHPDRSPLDDVFDHYHGNREAVDLELSKAATLAAEKSGRPTERAWAAFARCYNLAGFVNQYDEVHKDTFRKLVPELERLADSGDTHSQFILGLGSMHGFALEQDLQVSDRYFERAAARGHSAAAYWLGRSLAKRNITRSLSLLRLAAAFGNASAMASLGDIHYESDGTPNKGKAFQWYKAGAARKCPQAMLGLGLMLEDNAPETAFNLFSDAAAANSVGGFWKIGNCFHKGTGCEQDAEKAKAYYLKAVAENSLAAAHDLGSLYLEEEDFDKALDAFKWASARDWLPSMTAVGRCHENGWGCDVDIDLAKTWYTKAAEKGFAGAKDQLARLNPKPRRPAYRSNYSWQPSPSAHSNAQRAANRARQDLKRRINQTIPGGVQWIPARALYGR